MAQIQKNINLERLLFKELIYRSIYRIKRKSIWKSYSILLRNSNLLAETLKREQLILLREQVRYCYNNIEFYKKRFHDAGFNVSKDWSYDEFVRNVPILEKDEVRAALKDRNPVGEKLRLTKRQTSGSTGNPIVLYKDEEAMSFIDAAMHRNFLWYGVDIGDRRAQFWGRGSSLTSRLGFLFRDLITNWRRFNCFELSDSRVSHYHKLLKRFQPRYVYGYAKCIFEFVEFSKELGITANFPPVYVVVVTGEKITASQKQIIADYFEAPVAEEYGCTECGVIAFECFEGGMHVMSDILFVETVTGQAPSGLGNLGSIVLTELRGFYFPLIRYRIGDMGVLSGRKCRCGLGLPLIEGVQGRQDDYIICPDGTKIDAYCIEYSIQDIPQDLGIVRQVKGVQRSCSEIEVTIVGDFKNEEVWRKVFVAEVGKYLNQIRVNLEIVDNIPREYSGKLKFFKSAVSNNYE